MNLKEILDALDRLLKMFMFERYVYLALSIISFGILLVFSFQLLSDKDEASGTLLVAVFGGSGLVAVASARLTWFFNRAFTLIEKAVHGAQQ